MNGGISEVNKHISVSTAVEEQVRGRRTNFIFVFGGYATVVEVVPAVVDVVQTSGGVMASTKTSIMVGDGIEVIVDRVGFLVLKFEAVFAHI